MLKTPSRRFADQRGHPALDGVARWAWLDDVAPTRRLWAGAAAALAALLLGASCAPAPCPCSYSHVVNVAADDLPALLYLGALAAALVMSQAVRVAVKLDVLRARALATQGAICGVDGSLWAASAGFDVRPLRRVDERWMFCIR